MIRNGTYRPWGLLGKIAPRLGIEGFAFLGALSTEERSISAFSYLHSTGMVRERRFYSFVDAPSRFTSEVNARMDVRRTELTDLGVDAANVVTKPLLGLFGEISDDLSAFLGVAQSRSILVDISGMPKKLFFYAIRTLLGPGSRFDNVVVTYTEPATYHEGVLAENPGAWHALPGFLAPRLEPPDRALIVGLGFEPLGLPDLYSAGHFSTTETHLLLPVTAAQQHVSRNWDFVRMLESEAGALKTSIHRVDGRNVPDLFDSLSAITRRGEIYSVLAPFGPKPISLAMCLYACATGSSSNPASVFYTQPSVYHPNYSSGVATIGTFAATHAYCIKLNGQVLYRL